MSAPAPAASSGLPALAARLLAGAPLGRAEPAGLVDWLVARRVAAELAASPGLADSGLSRESRRRLAIERGRVGAAARTRAPSLQRAGRALAEAGVAAWLYKGEAFVRLTHGDPTRRPMADVDLVVSAAARERARRVLCEAGFTETPHATALHDVFLDERARGPGHPRGVALELHGDVFPPPHPFELDLRGVLERSSPSELPGLRLPSAEDALVLHAFHLLLFEQDARKSLQALRDLALLGEVCDESRLRDRSRRLGLGPVVAAARERAAVWAGGRAPARDPAEGERLGRRRRLALRLCLRELDAGLESEELEPPLRALSRRLSAALWQPRLLEGLRSLGRGIAGTGGGGPKARLVRYLAAWRRRARDA